MTARRPAVGDAFDATLMHGHDHAGQCVQGWYWSEKLHGCRAVWNGARLLTRTGRPIGAPSRIVGTLPRGLTVDFEAYAGIGQYELARRAVQYGEWHPNVHLVCFDLPRHAGDWATRIASAQRLGLAVAPHGTVQSTEHLAATLAAVLERGGEGLMLHRPGSAWHSGRTHDLLKLKHPDTLAAGAVA